MVAVALSSISASAADLYTKAPTMVASVYNWTGFYVGLNAGGALSESNATTSIGNPSPFTVSNTLAIGLAGNQQINRSGFTGGVTGGYNWQVSNAVLGIEADFNSFGVKGVASSTAPYFPPTLANNNFTVNSSVSSDWLATVRGRVGFLATPALLLYGTGGLAVANVKADYSFTDTFGLHESASISTTRYGWTAGAGGEYALMNGWSIKAEYLHVDLGEASNTGDHLLDNGSFKASVTHTVNLHSTNIGRVGVNYKFGGPAIAQ